ncbi:hypothetical protein AGDE_15430 [Angomonas deanei]|nr:hypothetical protein AGDE_15430 [Angomonas deanei]|eukprot:EPY19106.1 hypothetical protein AGDE_15430 [Angomonas deanei]
MTGGGGSGRSSTALWAIGLRHLLDVLCRLVDEIVIVRDGRRLRGHLAANHLHVLLLPTLRPLRASEDESAEVAADVLVEPKKVRQRKHIPSLFWIGLEKVVDNHTQAAGVAGELALGVAHLGIVHQRHIRRFKR